MIIINQDLDAYFPKDKTVVFLHAHADDESFLSAGIMEELIRLGRRCVAIYAAAALVKDQPKTVIRQEENLAACTIIGTQEIVYLKFCEPKYLDPDALRLIDQTPDAICESIDAVFKDYGILTPCILVSYDKNGGYGNDDHKKVHNAGRLFQERNHDLVSDLYEVTLHREKILAWLDTAKRRLTDDSLPKLSYWSVEFGLSNEDITHCFELSRNQIDLKRRALMAHASQNKPHEFPISLDIRDFTEVLGKEFFQKLQLGDNSLLFR